MKMHILSTSLILKTKRYNKFITKRKIKFEFQIHDFQSKMREQTKLFKHFISIFFLLQSKSTVLYIFSMK